ncbi:hypothetical protein PGUG_04660 [Meyerozyma guilliermondii ATCC 6260]|uniref:Biogenesis of lysosome-related organelles complex 1 subunit KXD1 n=1 Tax=Meyerozyma guilliermondii (strain ATCC 6260 / CBS 566 / DSM 6381 / JCM 1539 / NBRC 10279 / NRRL Y-324) TaxID=294746 RepID=A5DN09_PICGU|nr:uncharacterized protein PGUG_04660 [Meyerozyma guilliermondii ATCC 6260]EDK40562.2 hypothetical protein PGUG_04660 [Meyerozyma guilliermondii ATCC 6260]
MDQDMSTPTPPEEPEMADLDTGQPGDSSSESFFSSEDAESANNSHNDYQYMSIMDHSNYLSNALSSAMESIELDKSLALQAQLSGNLNNERQRLVDKQEEVLAKLQHIQTMYNKHFRPTTDTRGSHSRISTLESEFSRIEGHINRLKYGKDSSHLASIFKTKTPGIVESHPVEYNKARDKILERQIDESES